MNISMTKANSTESMTSVSEPVSSTTRNPFVNFTTAIWSTDPSGNNISMSLSTEYPSLPVNESAGMTTHSVSCSSVSNDGNCTTALPSIDHDSKDGLIAGIILLSLGAIASLILVGLWWRRRCRLKQKAAKESNRIEISLPMNIPGKLPPMQTPPDSEEYESMSQSGLPAEPSAADFKDDVVIVQMDHCSHHSSCSMVNGGYEISEFEALDGDDVRRDKVGHPTNSEASQDSIEGNKIRSAYIDIIVHSPSPEPDETQSNIKEKAENSIDGDDLEELYDYPSSLHDHSPLDEHNTATNAFDGGRSKSVELSLLVTPQYEKNRDSTRRHSSSAANYKQQRKGSILLGECKRDSGYNSLPSLNLQTRKVTDTLISESFENSDDPDRDTVCYLRKQFEDLQRVDSSETWGSSTFAIKRISKSGGKISLPDGTATLEVPEGALQTPRDIYIFRKPFQSSNGIPVIECGPDGLTFDNPVKLTAECDHLTVNPDVLKVFAKNDGEEKWRDLTNDEKKSKCVYDKESETIIFTLWHFTNITAAENSADISDDDNTLQNDLNAPGASASQSVPGAMAQAPHVRTTSGSTNTDEEIAYRVMIFLNCKEKDAYEFRVQLVREDDKVKRKDINRAYITDGWIMPCPDVNTVFINTTLGAVNITCSGETEEVILQNLLKCPQNVSFCMKPENEQKRTELTIRQKDNPAKHLLKTSFNMRCTQEDWRKSRKELVRQYHLECDESIEQGVLRNEELCLVRQPENSDSPSLCLPNKASDVMVCAPPSGIDKEEKERLVRPVPIQHDDRIFPIYENTVVSNGRQKENDVTKEPVNPDHTVAFVRHLSYDHETTATSIESEPSYNGDQNTTKERKHDKSGNGRAGKDSGYSSNPPQLTYTGFRESSIPNQF